MSELLHTTPSSELAEWYHVDRGSPIDSEWRADFRAGIVAATIANCHLGKNARPFKPSDFVPKFGQDAKQTAQEQKSLARQITKAFAAKSKGRIA